MEERKKMEDVYDCVVIGAGPGGLSASIYLGRALKRTLLVHAGPRRTSLAVHIQNYVGLEDISGPELLARGMRQAGKYGVETLLATVRKVEKRRGIFEVSTAEKTFLAKNVIAASGINDVLPDIGNMFEYMGKTFFTCFDCDGYHLSGRKIGIIGEGDGVARTALAVKQTYGSGITVFAKKKDGIAERYLARLEREGIRVLDQGIVSINGKDGIMESVALEDGTVLDLERILADLGYERNDAFLEGLDLKRSGTGYVKTDVHSESSIPGLFVVGPLNTGPDQVSVAVGQGAQAAMHIIEAGFDLEA